MIIYKIQNKINGKVYIGQTIRTLKQRMTQHLSPNKNKSISAIDGALKKYGIDNFEVTIIDFAKNIDELNTKEIYWIGYYKSLAPNGYNLEIGGKNAPNEKATRAKISQGLKGKYLGEKSSRGKRVYKFSLNGELIEEYGSVREASRENNISNSQISSVCRGEHFIAKGYRWSYDKNILSPLPNKSARIITYNGVSYNIKDWSKKLNIPYRTLLRRISAGWDIEKALNEPIMISKRNKR